MDIKLAESSRNGDDAGRDCQGSLSGVTECKMDQGKCKYQVILTHLIEPLKSDIFFLRYFRRRGDERLSFWEGLCNNLTY